MKFDTVYLYYPGWLTNLPDGCRTWLEERAQATFKGKRIVRISSSAGIGGHVDKVLPSFAVSTDGIAALLNQDGCDFGFFVDISYPFVDIFSVNSVCAATGSQVIVSSTGEIVACGATVCGESYQLSELRSTRVTSLFSFLVAQKIVDSWPLFYFNDGYASYWKSRTENSDPAQDPTPVEDVFYTYYRRAVGYVKNNNGLLLDVGCGHGRFFSQFISDGWAVAGVDVSWQAVDLAARKGGVPVTPGSQEHTGMPSNNYSFVNTWAVFDCAQQNEALHHLLGRLIKGGVLLLSGKHAGYHPDDQEAIAAELGAETKLFPNGFTHYDQLLDAIKYYGGEVCAQFFAPYRGDLAKGAVTEVRPSAFYEWVVIIRKVLPTPALSGQFLLSHPVSDIYVNAKG